MTSKVLETPEPEFARWPRYRAAELGFSEHWYPVTRTGDLRGRKPKGVRVLGQDIFLMRDKGRVWALHDRCPHRGIPLSCGRQEFSGTISCIYHGWTYDLETGRLVAALTDGANSPIVGKVGVRTYPVQESKGIVWVYVGNSEPPPLEADVPKEFLAQDAVVLSRITRRNGNWRYAAENGFDEAHAKFLHRNAVWMLFRYFPGWARVKIEEEEDGWITRAVSDMGFETDYPGLGKWPKPRFWRSKKGTARVSIRSPGVLRVRFREWNHYEWYVPIDGDSHLYCQFMHKETGSVGRVLSMIRYWVYVRWLFHWRFNNQDNKMVELLPGRSHPERLFRPDVSITAWRKLCESDRGVELAGSEIENA